MAQFAADGVPTIDGCRPAVLQFMADGQLYPLKDIVSGVAAVMGLPDDVVAQKVSSGQGRLENRVGWACSSMRQAGLLDRPQYGRYQITDDGKSVRHRQLLEYSEQEMHEWLAWREYWAELAERKQRQKSDGSDAAASGEAAGPAAVGTEPIGDCEMDPLSAVSDRVGELNDAVETELRAALQSSSPEFFERAVLSLLWSMGYAGAQGEKQHLGKSHDGGIDGVIRQDPLGLQNVYVQAKRYADDNSIGAPDINSFYGALARRGADRGVFITTSRFTLAARDAARQFQGRIVLIDGIRLTSLMLQYRVGVEPSQEFTVYRVDQDFFAE